MSLGALERAGGGDALRTLRSDFELFARSLKIRPEEGGRVVPFHLLAGQRRVRAACGDARRVLILKPRRLGITTLRLGVSLHGIWGRPHHQALMVGHRADDAQTIFESASLMDRELPEALKHHRATTNKREIVYDLMGSRLGIATAAGHGISRGDTLHEVHLTEVARYTGDVADTIAGLDEAARAGRMIGETTAYGARGWFYETWMECRSGGGPWLCVFAKWWWDDRNRIALSARERRRFRLTAEERVWAVPNRVPLEAVAWYREKCKTLKALVKQEYPCIAAGERVGTASGMVPIEDVRGSDALATGLVVRRIPKGRKPVVRVETADGYTLRCTPDHRLALAGTAGREFVAAEDAVGREVALQPPALARDEGTLACAIYRPLPGVVATVEVDERWGRFLGYFAGDGSYSYGTLSVVCTGRDEDVVADVAGLIRGLFGEPGIRTVGTKGGGREVRIGRAAAKAPLCALGVIEAHPRGDGCPGWKRRVCVPEVIWQSPRRIVREFLRGLFEADGFVGPACERVILFSKHREFLRDVQQLILAFGVTCRLRSMKRRGGAGYEYAGHELAFTMEQARAFADAIGFIGAWKLARAANRPDRGERSRARRRPMRLAATVARVEPDGEAEVYDLTMSDRPVFDASGILVHNCTDLEAFVVSGRHFFDQEKVVTMACNLPAPIASELGGAQLTWEDYDEDERYIIGADPAEGTPSGDWSYASVHARGDGRQVARYRAKCVPAEFARALARLGDRYGTALIVVERNRIEAVRRLRREEGYRNVYYRRLKSGKRDREPGYVIDTMTRPLVLDGLKEALEGWDEEPGWLVIRDPVFYSEATTFEDSGSGKYEASSGFHDDSILAIAIMLQARAVPIPTIRFV